VSQKRGERSSRQTSSLRPVREVGSRLLQAAHPEEQSSPSGEFQLLEAGAPARATRRQPLTWAVLDLFSAGAHGLGLSELDLQQLERLREERSRTSEPLAESA
jgi:hypothetical protein